MEFTASFVEDIFYVNTKLMHHENALGLVKCGLVFRFKPIASIFVVPSAPVLASI